MAFHRRQNSKLLLNNQHCNSTTNIATQQPTLQLNNQHCNSTTNIATQHLIWTFNIQLSHIQHRIAHKSTFNFEKSQ